MDRREAIRTMLGLPIAGAVVAGEEAGPSLVTPAAEQPLHLALPIPLRPGLAAGKRVDLLENGQVLATGDLLPGIAADGALNSKALTLAVVVPPRSGDDPLRQLKLRPVANPAAPAFRFADLDAGRTELREGDKPVMVYNQGVQSHAGVPAAMNRSSYVHPLYGLDGETITDDFPADHLYHRGLYWAWPHIGIGTREVSSWDLKGIETRFVQWLHKGAGSAAAMLGIENGWYVGEDRVMQERVWLLSYAAGPQVRVVDVDLTWVPTISPISLAGAPEKSYGGLSLRYAPRENTVITTPKGAGADDLLMTKLEWADLSAKFGGPHPPPLSQERERGVSGAAIFVSRDHPGYPPTWMTRHYGLLAVGWPGVKGATFDPGQPIRLRYRIIIHRGSADPTALAQMYEAYGVARKARFRA